MKKILLAVAFALSISSASAQLTVGSPAPSSTTQEEYNYATKGLRIQREGGLDMKAGYVMMNKSEFYDPSAVVEVEDLVRTNDKTLACIVVRVVGRNPSVKQEVYLAIPNVAQNMAVETQSFDTFIKLPTWAQRAVMGALAHRLRWAEAAVYPTRK